MTAEVYVDGTTAPRYFPLPRIGDDQGAYPHTLRFDAHGQIWMTMTKSNHLGLFDPATAMWTYLRLPEADPAEVGLSIPVAYGCDTAPDGTLNPQRTNLARFQALAPTTRGPAAWAAGQSSRIEVKVLSDGLVVIGGRSM